MGSVELVTEAEWTPCQHGAYVLHRRPLRLPSTKARTDLFFYETRVVLLVLPRLDPNGHRTEVVADRVQFGPRSGGDGGGATGAPAGDAPAAPAVPDYPEEEINPEDIPF